MQVLEARDKSFWSWFKFQSRTPNDRLDWTSTELTFLKDQSSVVDTNIKLKLVDSGKTLEISGFKSNAYYLIRFNYDFKSKDGKPINPKLGIIKFRTE
jgi:hypothetical protein